MCDETRILVIQFGAITVLVSDYFFYFFAGLTVFSLLTGLFYTSIVVLLQELIALSLHVTILVCVRAV